MEESLFDAYLDARLAGGPADPEAFLAAHPDADAATRESIQALHRVLENTADGPLPRERIGAYRLLRRLGGGGMASVYLAEHEGLRRLVALKILRPELAASRTAVRRFHREARAVARLRHPGIADVYDAGEEDGVCFLAMELVPGKPLSAVLAEERPSLPRVLAWGEQIAEALAEAHRNGVVHRDVKPGNVLVTPDGAAVLVDFGVAHLVEAEGSRLTRSFAGSPSYAAPEQLSPGGEVDARTDVYALGVTLYECTTGRLPFDGPSLEGLFQRILRDDPVPPRKQNASIPAALENVILKAMEKRPAARYPSAADLAADLRALREDRPVRARPPSVARRVARRARRHPVRATALATGLLALLALAGVLAARNRAEHARRLQAARDAVADAARRVAVYRDERTRSREMEERFRVLQRRSEDSYLSEEEDRELERTADAVDALRRRREAAFYEVLDLLRRAEGLDPHVRGANEVRARLYLERMEEAWDERDPVAAGFYRELVDRFDPEGAVTAPLRAAGSLTVTTDPPGAEAHLFRFASLAALAPEGPRRLVPVPAGDGVPPLAPGTPASRVVLGAGAVEPGDLVVDRRVLRRGRWLESAPFEGLVVRKTAAPLVACDASLAGNTPLRGTSLDPGDYVLLLRRAGCDEVRWVFALEPGERLAKEFELPPAGSTPPGFVRIPEDGGFLIQEREVTCAEYLEFLNDPETPGSRAPRNAQSAPAGGDWPRGADGRFTIPDDWREDWPVFGVSWNDAWAYARWRSRRDGRTYALPTRREWTFAAGAETSRAYVFGDHFRPKWVSSCFSQPRALPEPVLSYPVDESAYGVYDLTGSVCEWVDDWFDEGRGMRRFAGGSWAHGKPEPFQIWGGAGAEPDDAMHTVGFRLVIRP